MLRDVSNKHINGKKYPERIKGLPDDEPMNKTELLKLIDSVDVEKNQDQMIVWDNFEGIEYILDVTGGSPIPGEKRFTFVEKGWAEPKFKNRKV